MASFIEQELQDHEDPDTEPHFVRKATCKSIFCSKLAKGIMIALAMAIIVPTLAYFFVISRHLSDDDDTEQYYCLVKEEFRVSCGKSNISETECDKIYCCFNTTTKECYHFLPSKYYYKPDGNDKYLTSQNKSPVGSATLRYIKLTVQNKTANKVSLIIHDPSETVDSITTKNPNYTINQSTKKLILEVFDKDGDTIFTTAKGALIASDMYWEWSFQLSNGTLFGLDRNLIQLESNETLTKVIYKNEADHFTLPVFWAYQNGKFHGAVIKHDGPLEIQVLASNVVILRSLLGKKIEVELSLGPTPADLYRDQTDEMVVPPLWSLGTHNCRKGNSTTLSELLDIYKANSESSFDTDCIHENLFMALQKASNSDDDLTQLKTYIEELNTAQKKFLFSLPPHILIDESNELYKTAKNLDLLYKYQSGIIYNGTYLKQKVVYPDYTSESINEYIVTLISWIDTNLGLKYISGFILNDNWPQDDSYENVEKLDFPYYTEAIDNQMQYTLPWTLHGTDKVLHLEKHNSYGQSQNSSLHAYLNSLPIDEPLIISSTKRYGNTEPEISDNFDTSWDNFKMYLNKIVFSSITGNRMVGLPVCGDTLNYNKTLQETLCMRWYIAAATMPYFRVSSGDTFRDPRNLNSMFATKIAEEAMDRRALLQDYFYTILNNREPVVRPMYYDYYSNTTTFSMERQYTIGKDIIVAHPFSNGRVKLQVYLPPERGVWYEFWGGTMFIAQKTNGYYIDIDTLVTDWTVLVAEGSIVALTESSQMKLYIALDCSSTKNGCTAEGKLFKDNNILSFSATNSSVTISNLPTNCSYSVAFMRVYGYEGDSGFSSLYVKTVDLCSDNVNNITISYIEGQ